MTPPRSLRRLVAVCSLVAATAGAPRAVSAAPLGQADPDPRVRELLQRVERVVEIGETAGYLALLTTSADRAGAERFAASQFRPGSTRVVIQERDRQPLPGSLSGNGYSLTVDAFMEFGDRARVATWILEIKAVDNGWLIAGQDSVSAVENLYKLAINTKKQFEAKHFVVRAEDLELTLIEGTVFVVEIDARVTALVLTGRGEMKFSPAPVTEKEQTRIFGGAETLESRFDAAYVRVGSLAGHADLATLTARPVDPRDLKRAEQIFREESTKSFVVDLADLTRDTWSLSPGDDDFLAEVRTRRFDTLTYARSASEAEDISLFDRKAQHNIAVYPSRQKLATRGRFYNEDDLAQYDVLDYDVQVSASPERQWIEGKTMMHIRVRAPSLGQLTLRLNNSLVVRSIVSDQFGRLFSLRVANQNTVLVNLPSILLQDSEIALTVTYGGRVEPQAPEREMLALGQLRPAGQDPVPFPDFDSPFVPRPEATYLYSNMSYWYPQPTITDYASATMEIKVPAGFGCIASGQPAEDSPRSIAAGDAGVPQKIYTFVTDRPVRYLSFLLTRLARVDRGTIAFDPAASSTLAKDAPGLSGAVFDSIDLTIDANPRQVARAREWSESTVSILQFYQSLIGDSPYPTFTLAVVENTLPGGHSPGYFAILNQPIAGTRLTWRNDPAAFANYPEFFLAHEIAHQWWGQAVGWRNYHEQWLSEGFAQYFAALYAQKARGDDVFDGVIRQMRKWAMDESDQGPVYLGYRVGHIKGDGRAFRSIIYNKGAIVLHMLRSLVGDDAFFRGLRRFYVKSRFTKVGTDDFRLAMEAESNQSLERFFERWIYNSTLPRHVTLGYRVEPGQTAANGAAAARQDVVLHLEQTGEIFDMPVTVTLLYADHRPVNVVVPVTDRIVDFRVPAEGTLRGVEVSPDHGTLVDIIRN